LLRWTAEGGGCRHVIHVLAFAGVGARATLAGAVTKVPK